MEILLKKRIEQGLYRELKVYTGLIDFCSNDYLGLARNEKLAEYVRIILSDSDTDLISGSTGSRLLTGNNKLIMQLEIMLAQYHNAEAALVFNSGYDANLGLFSSVPLEGDTVIYDELIHASIHDGIRLGKAKSYIFRHNDLTHLEERLKIAVGNIYVAIESVYSMDGDFAPLKEILALCNNYGANLIVDEAHSTGVFGNNGEGLVASFNLEKNVFARIHTFGKAMGCHGAAILGSNLLRNFLINYARSFIYSTSLPPHSIASIMAAYKLLPEIKQERIFLHNIIESFRSKISSNASLITTNSYSAIQCIVIPGNDNVREFSHKIIKSGFDVRPVYSPTVAKGKERVRICLHSFNTIAQLNSLIEVINKD